MAEKDSAIPPAINLQLPLYNLYMNGLTLHISGPAVGSVKRTDLEIMFKLARPTIADFPTLAAGESYIVPLTFSVPGVFGKTSHQLQYPGDYQISFSYNYTPAKGIDMFEQPEEARGCWQGAVGSNELTLPMLQAGEEVNGLRLALLLRADTVPGNGIYTTTAYLENCTDKDIEVPSWDLQQQGLLLFDNNRKVLPMAGGIEHGLLDAKILKYVTINPGKVREFTLLKSSYIVNKQATEFPDGSFEIEDRSGFIRHIPVSSANYSLAQAVLDTETENMDLPENCWCGIVKSPMAMTYWDLTYYRHQRLQDSADDFEITLNYLGAQDKPFYSFKICSPSRVILEEPDNFHNTISLSPAEAIVIFSALAEQSILRGVNDQVKNLTATGYQMNILAGKKDNAISWQLNFATNLAMLKSFSAMQQALPADEQEKMTPLLARFTGLRAQWEAEAALQQRVSLSITGLSIAQAATAIVNAAAEGKIPLQIDEWMRDQPQPDLTLIDISAEDALQALAESADISCVVRQGRVIIRPFLL